MLFIWYVSINWLTAVLDIKSWPKLRFRRPINFHSYRRKHFFSKLIFSFLMYIFIILLFLTVFAGEQLSLGAFISLIAISSAVYLLFSCYVNFQLWWRSSLYLDSFDDTHNPSDPWALRVKRVLHNQRNKMPVRYILFQAILCIVQLFLKNSWLDLCKWNSGSSVKIVIGAQILTYPLGDIIYGHPVFIKALLQESQLLYDAAEGDYIGRCTILSMYF